MRIFQTLQERAVDRIGKVRFRQGCRAARRQFAHILQPDFHGFRRGDVVQELLGSFQFLAACLGTDAIGEVARIVGTHTFGIGRKLGHAPFEVLDGAERTETEGAVDGHGRHASAESSLPFIHELDFADLMFGLEASIEGKRLFTGGVVVSNLAVIVGIWLTAELAHQNLTPPMLVLSRHIERDAFGQKIAGSVALRRLRGSFDHFIQRLGRIVRVEASVGEELLVIEQGQRAHSSRQTVILIAALHRRNNREEFALNLVMRERVLRQRLQNTASHELVQPAVEKLHHVRALARHLRCDYARLIVVVRERDLLDFDVRIGLLEILDQLVHRLDACLEDILPIFDFDSLSGIDRKGAEPRNQTCQ